MDDIETGTIKKSEYIHLTNELFSDLLSTMTPNDLSNYLQIKRQKLGIMRNIPLSKLFFLFERENTLNVISHQVHLSETVELIAGTIVSEDIRQYRGFLLNIERASIYFYLFYWIFRLLNNFKVSKGALESYNSFWYFYEFLWNIQFPWGLIRPGSISHPISPPQVSVIHKIIRLQQKQAWKIAKSIEGETRLKNSLTEVSFSIDKLIKTGITGPISQSSGKIPPLIVPSSYLKRQSAQNFLKFTYTTENNLLNVLRVMYTELILSLDQISQMLKNYSITPQETSRSLNGEATTSFLTTLGESHLSLNILDNQVVYFNFIPPQMMNITGVIESLSICPRFLKSIILLIFDPEFLLFIE
ncbi:MAG: hypothetical protein ACFFFH_15045 [Candidatus Thorarchaeota archaeon]